jgi:hypothetical protein
MTEDSTHPPQVVRPGTTDTNEDVKALKATQWDRFPSSRRPLAMTLPDDPTLAAAGVVAYINGKSGVERGAAIEAMRDRAIALTKADLDGQLRGLAEQLPVLHALFLRFSVEAVAASDPDHRSKFMKIALGAQNSYARTQALVAALIAQQQGRGRVAAVEEAT